MTQPIAPSFCTRCGNSVNAGVHYCAVCGNDVSGAQASLAIAPHSEYVNITDAGHMVAGDRNDIFGNAVIDFLTRTVPINGAPLKPAHEPHPQHRGPPGDVVDVP